MVNDLLSFSRRGPAKGSFRAYGGPKKGPIKSCYGLAEAEHVQ